MEKINNLVQVLNNIKSLLNKISIKSDALERELNTASNHNLLKKQFGVEPSYIETVITDCIVSRTSNIELYKREFNKFCEFIALNESIELHCNEVPELAKVWMGDIYSSDGIEALKKMQQELSTTLNDLTSENIRSDVKQKLK